MVWWGCRQSTQCRVSHQPPNKLQLHSKGAAWYLQLIQTEIQIGKTISGEQPPLLGCSPASTEFADYSALLQTANISEMKIKGKNTHHEIAV